MDATYRLLGPLTATRGTQTIDLGPPKQRAALALLLLHRGRLVTTDRLVDALWGDEPPPSALASIQAYISNLRRALRDSAGASSAIVRRAQGYVLEVEPHQVDLAAFQQAARQARTHAEHQQWEQALTHADEALALWRGELLEDLSDQPWVQAETHSVEELRTECRETQITALLAAQRVAPALAAAQELRAAHPLRDRAAWLHMIALHRSGRSPEALELYTRHAAELDELGIQPGAELRELQTAILRHEPALAAWPRPASWTGAVQLHTPADLPQPEEPEAPASTLVGRTRETTILEDALQQPTARWLTLTGPAGIGKTRLAEELVGRARGAHVWARCSEEDGAPAWWPIRQLVRALDHDPDTLLAPPENIDADAARFAAYEKVAALLSGHPPQVVVVDDIQWADPTSARCLAFLVGALRETPTTFALTLRDGEPTQAIAPLLNALAQSDGHRQLTIGPLGNDDVRELASTIAGQPLSRREADELATRTGGNPLFVCEYARLPTAARETPLAVKSVLNRRLQDLDPEILQVLRAAAVIGDVVELPTLAKTLGMQPDLLADVLDEAADEHILAPSQDSTGYAFSHGLLREEILAAMPAMRRRRLHARVADAVQEISRRAQHLVQATGVVEPAEVVEACIAAAQDAELRWASEVAAGWWAEALKIAPERDDLLVARVAALARAGRGQTVLDVLDEALLDAARAGKTETVGKLAASLLRSSGSWPWPTYGDDPGPLLERLKSLEPFVSTDPAAHVSVLAATAVGSTYDPDGSVPDLTSQRALEIAETLDDEDALADALLGRILTYSGVAAFAQEVCELTQRLTGLRHREARVDAACARAAVSMAHFALGDVARAEQEVRLAIAECDLLQLPVIRVQLRWMEGTLATWKGDFAEAARHYEIGTRVHLQTELYYAGSAALAKLSLKREAEGLADADSDGAFEWAPWDAAIAAARGDFTSAEAHLKAYLDGQGPWIWITLGHVTLLAHTAADAGLKDQAPQLLQLLDPYQGMIAVIGHIGVINTVDLARARLLELLGEDATELRAQTKALAERTGGLPTALRC